MHIGPVFAGLSRCPCEPKEEEQHAFPAPSMFLA